MTGQRARATGRRMTAGLTAATTAAALLAAVPAPASATPGPAGTPQAAPGTPLAVPGRPQVVPGTPRAVPGAAASPPGKPGALVGKPNMAIGAPGGAQRRPDAAGLPSALVGGPGAAIGTAVGSSSAAVGTPGSAGIGDAYYPAAGNGGYDVFHYDAALDYAGRETGKVDATVTITAMSTQQLSRFDLDFRGPQVTGITVNGRPASFTRSGQELVVTPSAVIPSETKFTTVVRYSGVPGPASDGSLGTYGWVPTKDGAVALGEPDGTPTWLPVNDHPRDKATYAFHVTVPSDLQVVANGTPGASTRRGAKTTYEWTETSAMASYLATIAIGKFQIRRTKAGKVPVITAVDPKYASSARKLERTTVAALKWEASQFGPYPFATAGGTIDDPRLDYALETQERPVYAGFAPDETFVVHELAHQWFGDAVSLHDWKDIWLNEGFATYAEWLWAEHKGKDTTRRIFKKYYAQPAESPVFNPPPGSPARRDLFGFSVYIRGAMCLEALRERIGDARFFKLVKAWAARGWSASARKRSGTRSAKYGAATTAGFIALAEKMSGKSLDRLFQAWLYQKGKPKKW
ncbi:M1 family aminopeptidase [Actinomadura rupiterrae]|uniref:M1 family aminopeptidase n=1 Tax=Actinomadura rupiterrae TaxID=559627 RepID=UPI0020A2FC84|nr:M1 family aminopeptidase [Actinomadura rupiterrae]MCP2336767.1 aminopeptidase N [Actinomadura rupiterrae]